MRRRSLSCAGWRNMSYTVDFANVSTVGLESSPVADALAGLRANEARYFKNKYDHVFTVEPATPRASAMASTPVRRNIASTTRISLAVR